MAARRECAQCAESLGLLWWACIVEGADGRQPHVLADLVDRWASLTIVSASGTRVSASGTRVSASGTTDVDVNRVFRADSPCRRRRTLTSQILALSPAQSYLWCTLR